MATKRKACLGDAVYVEFDGSALWLTTEDGARETNRICLKLEAYRALTEYVARLPERTGLTASLPERPIPDAEDLR